MPISYSVDSDRRLILSRWDGVVTENDMLAHWRKIFSDKAALAVRRSLSDLRGVDLQVSGDNVRILTSQLVQPVLEQGPWSTAMIVDQPVILGIFRQMQVYSRMPESTQVFTDESAALEWLLAQ